MAQDARIRLIQQENGGVAAARNRGMREAEGQFLAFLDSDDLWKPEKLEYQLAFMREKQCVFSYAACDVIDENGDAVSKVRHVPEKITYNTLLKGNVIPCLTVVLDRNGVEEFSMPKMGHEDYAAWLNILKKIPVAYGTDRVLGSYRVNRKSVSANKLRTIGWTWRIYRENQKLSVFKSIRYLAGHLSQAVRKR
jgi:glycosyltransferase involved in cell wall biosynthesis